PDGAVTNYHFDDAFRLVGVSDGHGNAMAFGLDPAGNRIAEDFLDSSGVVRSSSESVFNSIGQLVLSNRGGLGEQSSTYDPNGRIQTRANALGVRWHYEHDALGRIAKTIENADGLTEQRAESDFYFDANDNLIRVV